jgi:type IV secretory pathway VirB2 component (pilin)
MFGERFNSSSFLLAHKHIRNLWDACIVLDAIIFLIVRIIGLTWNDPALLDISFDILSLEALFLVPRLCSILSLHPYFGTLIPCLKEMTKDFVKFLAVVMILYLGFLTTFAMLARDHFSVGHISWILVYVFFGSSYMGLDFSSQISPMLGPPLMVVFVCMTNVLLITSLISLLTNSLTKVRTKSYYAGQEGRRFLGDHNRVGLGKFVVILNSNVKRF